jgi:hypothetical protein
MLGTACHVVPIFVPYTLCFYFEKCPWRSQKSKNFKKRKKRPLRPPRPTWPPWSVTYSVKKQGQKQVIA